MRCRGTRRRPIERRRRPSGRHAACRARSACGRASARRQSIAEVLLFGGYALNIHYGLQTSFVRYGGHLQIQRRDYFLYGSGDPISYRIADYERVIDVVAHDPQLSK